MRSGRRTGSFGVVEAEATKVLAPIVYITGTLLSKHVFRPKSQPLQKQHSSCASHCCWIRAFVSGKYTYHGTSHALNYGDAVSNTHLLLALLDREVNKHRNVQHYQPDKDVLSHPWNGSWTQRYSLLTLEYSNVFTYASQFSGLAAIKSYYLVFGRRTSALYRVNKTSYLHVTTWAVPTHDPQGPRSMPRSAASCICLPHDYCLSASIRLHLRHYDFLHLDVT